MRTSTAFHGFCLKNTGKSSPAVLKMLVFEAGGRLRGTFKKVVVFFKVAPTASITLSKLGSWEEASNVLSSALDINGRQSDW